MSELSYGRRELGDPALAAHLEWRISNGIGGHASGTLSGALTRRHHGLLLAATQPPAGRMLLLAKLAEELVIDGTPHALDTNFWSSGAMVPSGLQHLERFVLDDLVPVWTWAIGDVRLEKRVWMEHGENTTVVHYRLAAATSPVELRIHAFANHRGEDDVSSFTGAARVEAASSGLRIEAFEGAAPWWLIAPGAEVRPRNDWYREFGLVDEPADAGPRRRDDHLLAAEIVATLRPGEDLMVVATTRPDAASGGALSLLSAPLRRRAHDRSLVETWRQAHPAAARHAPDWVRRLVLAADALLAETHVAGTPKVTPLGAVSGDALRDELVALPGLTVATGRLELARAALEALGARLMDGAGEHAPDAALWYAVAVRAYHEQSRDDAFLSLAYPWLDELASRIDRGVVPGASVDRTDGLLRLGEGPRPLTWTDPHARVAGLPLRAGKPVEVNALWFHMLVTVAGYARRLRRPITAWGARAERVERSFERFFNPDRGCLYDVIDGPSGHDARVRPNQILCVSLAESPLPAAQRRAVLEACGRMLLTSYGLRSLAAADEGEVPRDLPAAEAISRDAVMADAWTWLLPHYALAHARVHDNRTAALELLRPLEHLIDDRVAGYLPERTDGHPPHSPRGAGTCAWAVAETLRAWVRLAGDKPDLRRRSSTRAPREQEAAAR